MQKPGGLSIYKKQACGDGEYLHIGLDYFETSSTAEQSGAVKVCLLNGEERESLVCLFVERLCGFQIVARGKHLLANRFLNKVRKGVEFPKCEQVKVILQSRGIFANIGLKIGCPFMLE